MMSENTFSYSCKDFVDDKYCGKTKFDNQLCASWDLAMENDVFWYKLDDVERKILPGRFQMTAQLNRKRFAQRRKPDEAKQVMMPFNPEKFNFNKIKPQEILFNFKRHDQEVHNDKVNKIIINVSPIEYGHVLLVPNIEECLPQVLDEHAIITATELCLLSTRGLRIGFNSLCALASVNHQHFHVFYYEQDLPIDHAKVQSVKSNIYHLTEYMLNGWAVQLVDKRQLLTFSQTVSHITSYLCKCNIAHNLAICKRKVFDDSYDSSGVTVFIFPKKASAEVSGDPFNTASIECAGFLPIGDEHEFMSMTEEKAITILNSYAYDNKEFETLSKKVLQSVL